MFARARIYLKLNEDFDVSKGVTTLLWNVYPDIRVTQAVKVVAWEPGRAQSDMRPQPGPADRGRKDRDLRWLDEAPRPSET